MHKEWQQQLPYYIAGHLPKDAAAALEHHLASCAECRTALRQWQMIADVVRDDVADRVRSGVLPDYPLPDLPLLPQQNSSNGQHTLPAPYPLTKPQEEHDMLSSRTFPQERLRLPRPQAGLTLVAALVVVILFVVAMLAFRGGLHGQGMVPQSGGPVENGDVLEQGATATPSATHILPSQIQPTAVPPIVVTSTPVQMDFMTMMPPTVAPPSRPLPEAVRLSGITLEYQTWNNSGPATIAMALNYWGAAITQAEAAQVLKPEPEDKSVSPQEIVDYVDIHTPYEAFYRIGGTLDLLKQFVAAGYPVMIEVAFTPEGEDWIGHYLLVSGYDDAASEFYVYDSYLGDGEGNGRAISYSDLDAAWRAFNRVFIVVHDPARTTEYWRALGSYSDPQQGIMAALNAALHDVATDNTDLWTWLNLGEANLLLGQMADAALFYDRALALDPPWRLLWFRYGAYQAYYAAGRYDDVLAMAEATLATSPSVEQTYFWIGMAQAALGDTDAAREAFETAIARNENYVSPRYALDRLDAGITIIDPYTVLTLNWNGPTGDANAQSTAPTYGIIDSTGATIPATPTAIPPAAVMTVSPVMPSATHTHTPLPTLTLTPISQ